MSQLHLFIELLGLVFAALVCAWLIEYTAPKPDERDREQTDDQQGEP